MDRLTRIRLTHALLAEKARQKEGAKKAAKGRAKQSPAAANKEERRLRYLAYQRQWRADHPDLMKQYRSRTYRFKKETLKVTKRQLEIAEFLRQKLVAAGQLEPPKKEP